MQEADSDSITERPVNLTCMARIVPYNPIAFPPSLEVKSCRRDPSSLIIDEGNHRSSHRGALLFGDFWGGEYQKVTRRFKAKQIVKEFLDTQFRYI